MNGPEQLGMVGLAAALITLLAAIADHRRARRTDLDAVGFMPWTALFLLSLMIACVVLGLAARSWFAT